MNLRQLAASLCAVALVHLPVQNAAAAFRAGTGAPASAGAPVVSLPSLGNVSGHPSAFTIPGAGNVSIPAAANVGLPAVPALAVDGNAVSARTGIPEQSAVTVLESLGHEMLQAQPGSEQAAGSLDLHFENRGGKQGAPETGAAGVAGSFSAQAGSSLQPAGPRAPRTVSPSRLRSQSGKVSVGLLAGIGAAVVAVIVIIALVVSNGSKKNERWESTQARQQLAQVDRAQAERNAPELIRLAEDSRGKQDGARAELVGKKGEDAEKAKLEEAGFGLARMRGETGANAISTDPQQRPGKQPVTSWQQRLGDAARASQQEGSARPWLRAVRELDSELAAERALESRYAGDLDRFGQQVPSMARGALGAEHDKGARDLSGYRNEVREEERLAAQAKAEIRSFVSAQLAAQDPAYRSALARAERLARIDGGALATLDDQAAKIDGNLKTMAEERAHERESLAEADKHKADPVLDANGKPQLDAEGKPLTVDNSQQYKDKAARHRADAQAAAASLLANIESFNRDVSQLRRSEELKAEGVDRRVPGSANVKPADWDKKDLLDEWTLGQRQRNFTESEANDARVRFGETKGVVKSAQDGVAQSLSEQRGAINRAIDAEIEKQSKGW